MGLSQGEYILFLDSDDFLINNKIEKSMKVFQEKPQLQVVYLDWYVQEKGTTRKVARADHKNIPKVIHGNFNYPTFGMHNTSPPIKRPSHWASFIPLRFGPSRLIVALFWRGSNRTCSTPQGKRMSRMSGGNAKGIAGTGRLGRYRCWHPGAAGPGRGYCGAEWSSPNAAGSAPESGQTWHRGLYG